MDKTVGINIALIGLVILLAGLVWFGFTDSIEIYKADNPVDQMELTIYLQDKEEVLLNDCGITIATTINVPETQAIADASLAYLFADELAQYGEYDSVSIVDGVAQVTLKAENDPSGRKIASLSSCESRHLFVVLGDTLTQYDTITSVELYTPEGKVEF
jgi:hypothetical protein